MNWSTLAVSASLALLSTSAFAKDVVLKPMNENLETQTCYVAATESLSAARTLVTQNNVNFNTFSETLTCNGMRIARFANKYRAQEESSNREVNATRIALVAQNSDVASQLCLDALVIGENKARNKHELYGPVMCNGKDLPRFIINYQDQDVEIRNSAE